MSKDKINLIDVKDWPMNEGCNGKRTALLLEDTFSTNLRKVKEIQ